MYARAIREGIGHDGRALFPLMPYANFRRMSDEDLAAVVVYIKSLPPLRKAQSQSQVPFPISRLINGVPQPLTAPVPASGPARRGEYLVTMGSCFDCHTPQDDHGQRIPGLDFGGGFVLTSPVGQVASANLTP